MSVLELKLPAPHPAQEKILKSKARRITIMAGRQFGKSSLCVQICINEILKGKYTKGKHSIGKYPSVLYITPRFSLAKRFFKEILNYLPAEIIEESNQTDLYIKLVTGGEITFKSAEAGGIAFRGFRHSLIVCDEFAYYKNAKKFWTEDVEPCMSGYDGGRAYFISTPVGQNYFYEMYMKGYNYEVEYDSFHFTAYDNPHISHSFIDKKKEEYTELEFNQEYLAIPSANGANPFGLNINKNVIPELSKLKSVSFGIDLAKSVDWSVIIGIDNNGHMSFVDRWQSDWNITKSKIRTLPRNIDKLIDSTGVGDPILDDLKLDVPNIKGVKFNKTSKQNLIREFIKAVETGAIKYTQVVADEMNVFEYKYNSSTGHITYNAQAGYHDDLIVGASLSWWQYNRRTRRNNSWCIGTA